MRIRSRWLPKVVAMLVVGAVRALFATCRKVHLDAPGVPRFDLHPSERYILCVWHDSLLFPLFGARRDLAQQASCLTSRHFDGSYIAELTERLGLRAIRGSTNHGGTEAIRQLIDEAADRHVVITPDGPRGPRRVMKSGAVFLASQTGRQMVVAGFSCRRGWRIQGKWTDMLIPCPFTTLYLVPSVPITIPPNLPRPDLERHVAEVQSLFDEVNAHAERLARGEAIPEPAAQQMAA